MTTDASVIYLTKSEMRQRFGEPFFGLANVEEGIAWVRIDLPSWIKKSVTAHELQHLSDADRWHHMSVLHREFRGWVAGFKAHPIGFLGGIIWSLTPARIWLYIRRAWNNF